jgi:opacity protein-like surface antigen
MTDRSVRALLAFFAGILICDAALAQNAYRDKRWEFTLQMLGLEGKDYAFEGGSNASTKDSVGFGFGASYNVNPHLNFGGEIYWASMDYDATILQDGGGSSYTSRGEVEIWSFMLNATWNILAGPVTPYVQGGIGSTTVDSNIASGPPVNTCWWYPYYGYYCGTFVPTATSTSFAYNAGGGIRWDFNREAFMKFGVQRQWIDLDGATSSYSGMNVWRLEVGFKN